MVQTKISPANMLFGRAVDLDRWLVVLLESVTGSKDRLHTRRTGPHIIISSSNYTLEILVSKKQLKVQANRIVPFKFDE